MKYTRKENVKRAIHFQDPEYIPLLYYNLEETKESDIALIPVQKMFGGSDGRTSEWNFIWKEQDTPFALGLVERSPVPEWEDLKTYHPLVVNSWDRFELGREIMEAYKDRYYIADFILSGFTIMSFIRGFENFMTDLYLERENVEQLADIVFQAEEELIRACADAGFDAIAFGDDLGTQKSLLISPEIFREIFKPRLKRQCDLAHSLGMDIFFHSCGYILDLIPELIEAGVDILNPGQPALNGIEELGRRFRKKVCFGCPTGYQTTGVSGTKEEIESEIKAYVENLSLKKSGLIGLVWSGLESLGATREIQECVLASWEKYCGKNSIYN